MTDPHTQEQTQNPQQEPVRAAAAPSTATTSGIHGTGPGLVATGRFHPTPTPHKQQSIAAARRGEPLPGAQTNQPPVLLHDETEPVQVVYHTGRAGTEASKHPAEFARQLSRQYEALSYLTVDEYLKGRDLYNTQKRAPNSSAIETDRGNLEKKIVDRLVDEYRFDRSDAKAKAVEAVQALVALHETDQSLQGSHQLAAGEMFGATCRSTPAIGSQHKAGLARLGQIAHAVQKAGKGHHYLNARVVLCGSPRLASPIRREKAAIIFDPTARREQVSHYTRMNPGALAQ